MGSVCTRAARLGRKGDILTTDTEGARAGLGVADTVPARAANPGAVTDKTDGVIDASHPWSELEADCVGLVGSTLSEASVLDGISAGTAVRGGDT